MPNFLEKIKSLDCPCPQPIRVQLEPRRKRRVKARATIKTNRSVGAAVAPTSKTVRKQKKLDGSLKP